MLRSRGIDEPRRTGLRSGRMRRRHLRGVMAIERQVYARPWSPNLFVAEMTEPNNRCYLVARFDRGRRRVRGDDLLRGRGAHHEHRGRSACSTGHHIGSRLLLEQMTQAIEMGAQAVSLEVRVTNWGAQRMYGRFGFRPVGIRRNYYQELNEDALIMWTDDVRGPRLRAPARLDRGITARGNEARDAPVMRGDHARHRDLVRRDGGRGRRGRLHRPLEPDRVPGPPARAVRRRRARGGRARPRRGVEPVDGRGARHGGGRVRRSRHRSGHGRAGAGRRAPRGDGGREGRCARDGRDAGGRESPRGTRVGELPRARAAGAAVRRADRERRPHDAGPHPRGPPPRDARPDARRCGGGGLRQGRAADRARVPGRAGPRRDGARAATPPRSASRGRWRARATSTSR